VRAAQEVGGAIQELFVLVDGRPAGLVSIQGLGNALAAAEQRPASTAA